MTYILLLAIQMFGSIFIVWTGTSAFRELIIRPGEQLALTPNGGKFIVSLLLAMQAPYWYRLLRVAIPIRRSSVFLPNLFLYLGRLNFIFGSTVFAVTIFRHVPELGPDVDVLLMAHRGALFLFSLLRCSAAPLARAPEVLSKGFAIDGFWRKAGAFNIFESRRTSDYLDYDALVGP